jgi:cyclomaltodextrinase / maltogenic alpha-amylase / neopullulanase
MKTLILLCSFLFLSLEALSQDSVDVTFRYNAPSVQSWMVVGEFTNWAINGLTMTPLGNGIYVRTVRLALTGGVYTPGAYEYKFTSPNIISQGQPWPNDPLNPRTDGAQNSNSVLYVKNPTIYQFVPNQVTGVVKTATPTISAYIFPKLGSSLDTGLITLKVDSVLYANLGTSYNASSQQFSFKVTKPLSNGVHSVYLTAGSTIDSVTIGVQAGLITNIGNFTTLNPVRTLYGIVDDLGPDTVWITRNSVDTIIAVSNGGKYSTNVNLVEGLNTFEAYAKDSLGVLQLSSPVPFTYYVNHAPNAVVTYADNGSAISISASQSTDPDPSQTASLTFQWSADTANPESLVGLNATGPNSSITRPTIPGDYIVQLIAKDASSNADTARSLFTIGRDGSFSGSSATVPLWAKEGRIYSFYFNGLTGAPVGQKINAAVAILPYIKAMGYNMLWILPVMKNHYTIDNASGPGYDITDFYNVAPEYGTNADFKNFVRQAHALGLKVILDVTPNHTSAGHPFAIQARQYRENSPYWSFYQHQLVTNPNYYPNLSEAITNDGFVYYGGFSSELLNYNWTDVDARQYMINVYKWWIKEFDIDGYRFDVYWGPHDRANNGSGGENEMGLPVRQALKHIKPDIWLLGETDGTSYGTQVNYADQGGGIDAGYDWPLKDAVHGLFPNGYQYFADRIFDSGYFPGPNSSYLRFLENQDEDRIVHVYGQYPGTKPPGSVIFTAPGTPMIWEGEELGIGLLVPSGQDVRRAVVNWNQADPYNLRPHYQRLAQIRAQFPAFSTQRMQVLSSPAKVYAYERPYVGEAGIVAVNFNDTAVTTSLQIARASLDSTLQDNHPYVLSDLYNDNFDTVAFVGGSLTLNVNLAPYGSSIFVLSDTARHLILPALPIITSVNSKGQVVQAPREFRLLNNYPNPFNPSTTLTFDMMVAGQVTLKIYNLLGQEVAELMNGFQQSGRHMIMWNGLDNRGMQVGSGVYFARLQEGSLVDVKKLVLLR